MSEAPVLIMAGGTGGHVFPALAVARALRGRNESVVWLGTRQGLESRDRAGGGHSRSRRSASSGLRRKGALTWLAAPWRLLVALADALRVVRRRRPKVVLGMGGFASGPGGLAAWLLGRPLVIHEQNAVAGLTNRLLAGFAREVLEAFPGSFSASRKTRVIGNPDPRRDIRRCPHPAERLAGRTGALRLLVLGGSQGARALNETVPRAVALLPAGSRPEIWHQAGEATLDVARAAYRDGRRRARASSRSSPTWRRPTPGPTSWSAGPARSPSRSSPRPASPPCWCRFPARSTITRRATPRTSWTRAPPCCCRRPS